MYVLPEQAESCDGIGFRKSDTVRGLDHSKAVSSPQIHDKADILVAEAHLDPSISRWLLLLLLLLTTWQSGQASPIVVSCKYENILMVFPSRSILSNAFIF